MSERDLKNNPEVMLATRVIRPLSHADGFRRVSLRATNHPEPFRTVFSREINTVQNTIFWNREHKQSIFNPNPSFSASIPDGLKTMKTLF